MMNCTNCGKDLVTDAKFCDECGSPVVTAKETAEATAQANTTQTATQTATQTYTTANASVNNEAQDNKVIFILAYLGILFFLPLVSCPNSKVGRFHANQGLVLLLAGIAGQIAVGILSGIILAISWRLWAITSLLSFALGIALLALMIMGMVNANKGEQKPLPVIGKITIIK
jgi:uncharacterized membrane protein